MHTLFLNPGRTSLQYAWFASGRRPPVAEGSLDFDGTSDRAGQLLSGPIRARRPEGTYRVALRVLFGGDEFTAPCAIACRAHEAAPNSPKGEAKSEEPADVVRKLQSLLPRSPLHIPRVLSLTEAARDLPRCDAVVLVFETSFFTEMPPREHTYGLPPDLAEDLGLRRYGFHGLYHARACREARRHLDRDGSAGAPRLLSICLEPKPEVSAVIGRKPITVTGGATPLEGIPGESSSGEIDPTIVLTLAQNKGWGPEQINRILTRQSGISGLTGERLALGALLGSEDPEHRLARKILEYRIQMACGAGISAMGGIDALVFSGRYAAAAEPLATRLKQRLLPALHRHADLPVHHCTESLPRIVADVAGAIKRPSR